MSDETTQATQTNPITIRIPNDLRDRIEQIATEEDRNASYVIRNILRKALGMTDETQTESTEA
jgi:predicted transcriptional regulator